MSEMEEIVDLGIMGIGAGVRPAIAGVIAKHIPPIAPWAGLLAGAAIYFLGGRVHPKLRVFGAGVLVSAIGELLAPFVPKPGGGGGGAVHAPATPEEYIKARWGI